MSGLKKHLKDKQFSNLYLIFGGEDYLKKHYQKKLTDAIIKDQEKLMNYVFFEGKNADSEKIINASDTLPFMAEKRLVVVKNSELFFEGRKAETEKLLAYLKKVPETTIIIFIEEKVDKRLKIFKEFSKLGYTEEMNPQTEANLLKWVDQIFKQNKKTAQNSDIIYLIRCVGNSMDTIYNEVQKLIAYKKDETEIKKDDIDKICTKSLEMKIFDLIDAIVSQKAQLAVEIYKNLISNKTSPFMIISMISRQFRLILQTKQLLKQNKSSSEIARELNLREFAARAYLKQASVFSEKALIAALNDCKQADISIKIGKLDEIISVEMLIIKYSSNLYTA